MTRQQKQFELAGIVRNRIVERQMLRPGDLLDHPGQWRDHTDAQAQAMAGILREVGIASTLKAWRSERAGGGLVTWDGHLRKSLDPDLEWPVDILDITDAEADYLLSVFDPVSAMATADAGALDALLSSVQSGEAAVQAMLAELAEGAGLYAALDGADVPFSEFDEAATVGGFVPFKFGDYSGKVSAVVYDAFVGEYRAQQERTGEPMLDDVLRGWLGV